MVTAVFSESKFTTTYELWQYDYGQILRIQGLKLPRNVEIHFALQETGGIALPRVGVTRDGVTDVVIPDSMLENNGVTADYYIYAFIYLTNKTSGQTEYEIKMRVKSRPRPEVPGGGEDLDPFHEAVQKVNEAAERAETAEKNAESKVIEAESWVHGHKDHPERNEDNAKYYAGKASEDAKKTTADRTAVESVVQDVTQMQGDVARDLEQVQKLTEQAQTSATNAALSEQAAKVSETNAQTAQTGAETAEANAELAECNTKTSEQAVEKAKQLVTQMGQEVLDNKNHVDQTVHNFDLTTQQALADVNNAGQTQTERVEGAGNTAVESVKTAQNAATKSVEAVKTDAVDDVKGAGTEQTQKVTDEGAKQVKAVEDKGNEVLQSIPEDFTTQMQSKLDKNQGAENKGKALVVGDDGNVVVGEVTGGDGIPIINTMSGESPLVVPDSAERVNKGFSIIGNTNQFSTTGMNLFDEKNLLDFDSSNYDKTAAGTGVIRYKFKVSGTVTVSVANINKDGEYLCVGIGADGSDAFWLSHKSATSSNFKTLTPKDGNIYLGVNNYIDGVKNMIKKVGGIMINYGSVAMPYEPYTGGKPSPSPEYPQEIKNVGKWNPETQKYEVNIRITNAKESWDKEQTITLTSDRPITKWDKLVEQEGQIGWLYGSKNYKVTGNEILESRDGYNVESYTNRFFVLNDLPIDESTPRPLAYVKNLKGVQYIYSPNINKEGFDINRNQFHIKLSNDRVGILTSDDYAVRSTKLSEYMKKLYEDGNPIEFWYMTNYTTFTPLPQSEQDAIRALMTCYPTTVITVDGGGVVPTVELTYTADTKNFILNREKVMRAQMFNIQNALISQKISGGGIKVSDSARVPVIKFSMWGKTEQVQTTGKNLFSSLYDEYTFPSNYYIYPLALEKGETYTASLKSISAIKNIVIYIVKSGNMYPFEGASVLTILLNLNDTLGEKKVTFTVDETFTAPAIAIYAESKEYFNSIFKAKEIQLEKGSVATSYEPYTGGKPSPSPEYPQPIEVTDKSVIITIKGGTEQQSITLVPPRPLTKWDKLEKIDGVWKWVYQSDNAIYDGSENWIGYSEENRKGVFELRVNSAKRKESADIFCSRYKGVYEPIDRLQDNEITLYYSRLDNNPNDNWIDLKDTAYSDVSEFKKSLFENPLTVYYETTTPEYIPLSQSEQNKLNSLTMYAPTTEIINDGGCNMELTYTVDTKSYIDTKIAEISKAIL